MNRTKHIAIVSLLTLGWLPLASYLPSQEKPGAKKSVYYLYVTAESEDEVSIVRFDGKKATAWKTIQVGELPTEIEGAHGLAVDPNGKHWYLSIAHGRPFGYVYKYTTKDNKLAGKVKLGMFPATMQISKSTGLLYVVNFNLHGKMKPSSVSIVDPDEMVEIERITTGPMPHGSRLSPDGKLHYSCAMMSGELFEIDAVEMKIKRKLNLDHQLGYKHAKAKMKTKMHMHSKTKPTWVFPHPDGKRVYVACNGSDEVVEIDLKNWKVSRRFKTGKGPYNVEVAPNGKKMAVTYKSAAMTAFWDLGAGKELARIKNTRKVTHGVVYSSDSRYAFVSVEGVGGEPGAVEVFDAHSYKRVATTDIGKQAGGIYFWKIDSK